MEGLYGRLRLRKGGSGANLSPGAVSSILSILHHVLGCTKALNVFMSSGILSVEIGRARGSLPVLDLPRRVVLRRCLRRRPSTLGLKVLLYLLAKVHVKRLYTLA